ncbi:hypothetical protein [Dyadobacter aurulentus]|uniref:hypothetical protein n=1 Tax=Dyadobacter sp. UC 10 TaxID=2605428 RepID=UPI0011F3B2DC|nr:hypothetical protein [Dyadobacter sp. UC 10]KAA0993023.1 hypothetical protein FXO21_24060 [Dyadobacter sp. UC 10]
MVEVFKTNVSKRQQADLLVALIARTFPHYHASFDLEDCDKILRISSVGGDICAAGVARFMQDFGYEAEILKDELCYLPSIMELGFQPFQTHES